jgi:hypothetical protein
VVGGYATFSGTSMATPHVAGTAALVLAASPALTTDQLIGRILGTVTPLASMNGVTVSGGIVNAFDAVRGPVSDLNWTGGGITGPTSVTAGAPFTISRTYNVAGAAADRDFAISYVRSTNATFGDADDVVLGTETITAAADKSVGLHSGVSPSFSIATAGTYYLFAQLDAAGNLLETNEGNNVAQAPDQLVVTGGGANVIIDDGQAGYAEAGGGWAYGGLAGGYLGDYRYKGSGSGTGTATWTFSGLSSGSYQVYTTWTAHTNRATNAPYTVFDNATALATVKLNQQAAPNDDIYSGQPWESIGTFTISSGILKVRLTDLANGVVVADAVRIVSLSAPTKPDLRWAAAIDAPASAGVAAPFTIARTYTVADLAVGPDFQIGYYRSTDNVFGNADDVLLGTETVNTAGGKSVGDHAGSSPAFSIGTAGTYYLFARLDEGGAVAEGDETNNVSASDVIVIGSSPTIIDDGEAGYAEAGGGWAYGGLSGGYLGDYRYKGSGSGTGTATWTFTGLAAGNYQVQTTWTAHANRATNAPYTVLDNATALGTVKLNQQAAPNDELAAGQWWENVGTFTVSSGILKVRLSDLANGVVVADAVRIVSLGGAGGAGAAGSQDGRTSDWAAAAVLSLDGLAGRPDVPGLGSLLTARSHGTAQAAARAETSSAAPARSVVDRLFTWPSRRAEGSMHSGWSLLSPGSDSLADAWAARGNADLQGVL